MTDEKLFEDFYTEEQVAKLMGIAVGTLRNRITNRANHPPFVGLAKNKRFPKDEFKKWAKGALTHQKNRAS